MRRHAEKDVEQWLRSERRKPLVIRGARQVGKSTLVRNVVQSLGRPLWEVNLERHRGLDSVFATYNVKRILTEIGFQTGISVEPTGNGVLFLDEIQATPNAIPALRYFFEEMPQLPVVAAGSLMEFALADHAWPMPVGRIEYLYMGPVTFEEYLAARNETQLLDYQAGYTPHQEPSEAAHGRLLLLLREYLLVGGMPEAVATFIQGQSFAAATEVHRSIVDTYRDDFGKYAGKEQLQKLRRVYEFVPQSVGAKFKYVNVNPDWKAAEVRAAVDLLALAHVIQRVHHSNAAAAPLSAGQDDGVFKPLFLDVGLMNAVNGVRSLPEDQFLHARFVNEGPMAEQFIGQHLLYAQGRGARPSLHYWLREGRKNNAEVDYLIESGPTIVPVEVKAGAGGSLKSLQQFVVARKSRVALRFDLGPPSIAEVNHGMVAEGGEKKSVSFTLCSLPLYMVEQAPRIVSGLLAG